MFLGRCTEFFGSIRRPWWKRKLIWNTWWYAGKGVPSSRHILLHYMPYLPNVASGFGIRCPHVPPLGRAGKWKHYPIVRTPCPGWSLAWSGRTAPPRRLMKGVAMWLQTFLHIGAQWKVNEKRLLAKREVFNKNLFFFAKKTPSFFSDPTTLQVHGSLGSCYLDTRQEHALDSIRTVSTLRKEIFEFQHKQRWRRMWILGKDSWICAGSPQGFQRWKI